MRWLSENRKKVVRVGQRGLVAFLLGALGAATDVGLLDGAVGQGLVALVRLFG